MATKRKRQIALMITAILAVLYLVAIYGTSLLANPFASVQLNGPVTADSDGEYTAITDTESRRVLIMNSSGKLTGVIDCTTFDTPIEIVTDACVSDGTIYVAGEKLQPDSIFPDYERVLAYDTSGELKATVYDKSVWNDTYSTIICLSPAENGVIIAMKEIVLNSSDSTQNTFVTFKFANEKELRELKQVSADDYRVFDVAHDPTYNDYAAVSVDGTLEDDNGSHSFTDHVFVAVDMDKAGNIYASDDVTGAVCTISDDYTVAELIEGAGYDDMHVNGENISCTDRESDAVVIYDTKGNEITSFISVEPTLRFCLKTVLLWLCVAYLFALAILYAIRRTRKIIADGQTRIISALFASFAVVVALCTALASLSYTTYQTSIQERDAEVGMCADYIGIENESITAALEKCNDRKKLRAGGEEQEEAIEAAWEAESEASTLTMMANNNGIGMYSTIYAKDDQGFFYLADFDYEQVLGTSVPQSKNEELLGISSSIEASFDFDIHEGRSLNDSTRYRLVGIPSSDGTEIIGVVEVGTRVRSLDAMLRADAARNLLGILVLVLVVFLGYSEIRAGGRCLYAYWNLQENRARDAVAALTRPFTLCITMLMSVDSVMTILIARDLLENIGIGESSFLIALPAVMLGLGLAAGQLLFAILGKRVGLQKLIAAGGFLAMCCALFTVLSVSYNNFWLYCVAKLVLSIPLGLLYSTGYSLPRIAKTDSVRNIAMMGVKRTDTSAAALGTVLGGYAAQALGNAWVYVIVALACLPIILMAIGLLPNNAPPIDRPENPVERNGSLLRFIKSRSTLSLAFLIILPATIAAGYASFLFPLFSADLGLGKSEINNIYVLGQLIVYVSIGILDDVEKRRGSWTVTTAALAMLGVVFLLFSINTTLIWSIVVIVIVGVLGKATNGWKPMWITSALKTGVQASEATGTMFSARSLSLLAQPFVMGALIATADSSTSVIVIGAFCALCAGLFFLLTRHTLSDPQ